MRRPVEVKVHRPVVQVGRVAPHGVAVKSVGIADHLVLAVEEEVVADVVVEPDTIRREEAVCVQKPRGGSGPLETVALETGGERVAGLGEAQRGEQQPQRRSMTHTGLPAPACLADVRPQTPGRA